jgi:hypothetical protein
VSSTDLKYAILHLQAATEVLLKHRLYLEHWTLILANLDVYRASKNNKMTRARFDRGNFISCNIDETVDRLRYVVGVPINDAQHRQIRALTNTRNALEHYGLTDPDLAIETRIIDVLDFLIQFLDDELLPKLDPTERQQADSDRDWIRNHIMNMRSFVDTRLKRLKDQLEPHKDRVLVCPYCTQWTLLAGDPPVCRLCAVPEHAQITAEDYATEVLGHAWRPQPSEGRPFVPAPSPPVDPCPGCGAMTLVRGAVTLAAQNRPTNFCFTCTAIFPEI